MIFGSENGTSMFMVPWVDRKQGGERRVLSQNAGAQPSKADVQPLGGLAVLRARCVEWLDPTKRRALIAFIIRIIGAGVAYGMQILLAQWMGLAEYGVFVGVWVWLLVLGGIAPLGLNVSAIGLLATYNDTGDIERWRGLLATSVVATMGAGLLVAGSGWTVLYLFPGLVSDQYLMPVWLCLFCVPLLALSEINEGISRAHGWMNTALMPTYLLRPLLLIGFSFAAVQSGAKLDATLVMTIAILAAVLTVIAQGCVLLLRLIRLNGKGVFGGTPMTWVLMSLPIVMAQTFELITQNFDMIAVSYFLGPEKTGIYFAALKTIALVAFVNFAVGAATANRVASLRATGQLVELRNVLDGAVNLAFWPTLLGAVVISLMAPLLLSLFGHDFAGHAYLTVVLAIGFVARSFVGPAELYLNVLGYQKVCAMVLLSAAVLNMALNILLIPSIGLLGAAIATSISLVVLSAGLFLLVRRSIGVSLYPSIPVTSLRKLLSRAKAA